MKKLTRSQLYDSLTEEQLWTLTEVLQIFQQRDALPQMQSDRTLSRIQLKHFTRLTDGNPEGWIFFAVQIEYYWGDGYGYDRVLNARIIDAVRFADQSEFNLARHLVRVGSLTPHFSSN